MEMSTARAYLVEETSQAGEARRGAMALAREIGFDDVDAGKVGIVVTEAATNMMKHAHGGRVLVQAMDGGARRGMGALALDRGPGVSDLPRMLGDGVSTRGTRGTGLGAIVRQSQQFDAYSQPGKGTALFTAFWPRDGSPRGENLAIGGVSVPKPGEQECGDGWAYDVQEGRLVLAVADGLGHGTLAREASSLALEVLARQARNPLPTIAERMHTALRSTRGAAVTLIEIGPGGDTVRYLGIGNIAGRVFSDGTERRLVSLFGTMGHDVRRFQEFQYPWPRGATLVLHTDGLSERWTLDDYPGLSRRDPTLVAGVLYRDHARERDDCTVVVVRNAS
jgi:anti-sigma regulatory factor (Ser/Thr protein kinase)